MVIFVVPVKSAQVSSNWKVFSLLVDRTLRSICQQTHPDFKVIIACHEIPEVSFSHPAIEYLQVDFDPPTEDRINDPNLFDPRNPYRNVAKEEDKARKILAGIEKGRTYNPEYFMVVDADDCIHRDLVKYVQENKTENTVGWFFRKGYIYNEGSRLIFLNMNTFNILCGTCIIVHADYVDALFEFEPFVVFTHDFEDVGSGKSLLPLPFPGAVYSIGNTENYCSTPEAVKRMNSYRFLDKEFYVNIIRKMRKYRMQLLNRELRARYGLYKLDFSKVFTPTGADQELTGG